MRTFTVYTATSLLLFIALAAFKPCSGGKDLYMHNCSTCHGETGDRGRLGAKDLRKSILPDSAIILQMQNGKKIMPSFRKKLSPDEMNEIMQYVKTLRQN